MTQAPSPTFDLLCIGNAIVDLLAPVTDATLEKLGSAKGGMTLIDATTADRIEADITPETIMGGGSAANTAVTARKLGLSVSYLGKVAEDDAGRHFAADLRALGIDFPSTPLPPERQIPTARCIVLITPDGQRTMHTYLGACVEFGTHDVTEAHVAAAATLYLEGYLFDGAEAQAAFVRAAEIAHAHGRKVALTLSDAFCVHRHRAAFRALVAGHIDILFANEAEILALYETDHFETAARQVAAETDLAALTRSEHGCVIVSKGEIIAVPTEPVTVIDSTGAGDAFAAGFIAGLTRGYSPADAGAIANKAAAAVITRVGARPGNDFALTV